MTLWEHRGCEKETCGEQTVWKRGKRFRKASYRSVVKRICMQEDRVTARRGERRAGELAYAAWCRCRGRPLVRRARR